MFLTYQDGSVLTSSTELGEIRSLRKKNQELCFVCGACEMSVRDPRRGVKWAARWMSGTHQTSRI